MGFTGFSWVLPSLTWFYLVLQDFTGLYWALLGFIGCEEAVHLLDFTEIYWFLLQSHKNVKKNPKKTSCFIRLHNQIRDWVRIAMAVGCADETTYGDWLIDEITTANENYAIDGRRWKVPLFGSVRQLFEDR